MSYGECRIEKAIECYLLFSQSRLPHLDNVYRFAPLTASSIATFQNILILSICSLWETIYNVHIFVVIYNNVDDTSKGSAFAVHCCHMDDVPMRAPMARAKNFGGCNPI